MEAVYSWISYHGYYALPVLLMLGIVGLPIPDETLLVFCGYLIWKGRLLPVPIFFAGLAGSLSGITLSYFLGRTYGRQLVDRFGSYIGLTHIRMAKLEGWFARFGPSLLTGGYFIAGVRHFTALIAGMSELPFATFALFAYSGAAIWVAAFLSLGYLVGDQWQHTSAVVHKYLVIGTVIGIALFVALRFVHRKRS